MCVGIAMFANNKKVKYGKGTNSHSTTAEKQHFNEDNYRKYEYHWWKKEIVDEHYDSYAENLLKGIDKKVSDKLIRVYIGKHFKTPAQIYAWLKDVPDEWSHLQEVKDRKMKSYLFKKITGYTLSENKKALVKAQNKVKVFVKRVEKVKWFKPQPTISKKEISLKVGITFNMFKLPTANLEFKFLSSDAAWDEARGAAWGAARDAAWDAAMGAARDEAWGAARDEAWGAEALIVEDLKAYKKKYPKNPFMPLFELWEMGLYPIGLVKGKFLIYVPLLENGKKPRIV
jgi:hypothetical protein